MKILQITPILPSAITILAKQIIKHNKDIEIKLATFHPKRPDSKEIENVRKLWNWCDLVDMQYWKSAAKIRETLPNLWKTKKKIISHYNPYNLKEETWDDYAASIVVNKYQKSILPNSRLVPLSIELDFWTFNRSNYTVDPIVNMSVSRIEGKKGVEEVAQACKELGYKFLLVGRVSDGNYMNRVKKAAGGILEFRNNVSDMEVRKAYHQSAIHVCHSIDNFESGTMPVLESMACGLPVLSRPVGHVPDIYNGKNLHLNEAGHENIEALKGHMKRMMEDRRYRISLRNEAVESVKERSAVIRAKTYRSIYEEVLK